MMKRATRAGGVLLRAWGAVMSKSKAVGTVGISFSLAHFVTPQAF